MRFYQIALFLFIIQTFGGLLAAYAEEMGISAVIYAETPPKEAIQRIEATKTQIANITGQVTSENPLSAALGWFYSQLNAIGNKLFSALFPLVKYIAWLPFYLNSIGVPPAFSWGIFSVLILIEIIGFYEFITGREIEK